MFVNEHIACHFDPQVAAGEEEEAGADDAMDSGVVRAMEAMAAVEHRAAELLATLQ